MIKISIITATYNSEKYVERTIRSVIEQTYSEIEFIIIDGYSKDRTVDIVNNYKENVDIFVSEPDEGIYDAFNKGIVHATGDIIYFLNSDDYLVSSTIIEDVMNSFDDDISLVYGNVQMIYEDKQAPRLYGREFTLDDFSKGYAPPHQAVFARKWLFDTYGLFNKNHRVVGDFERSAYFFKYELERTKYINKVIAAFHVGGISSNYTTRVIGMLEKEKVIKDLFQVERTLAEVEIRNNALYRHWLEKLLLEKKGITNCLHNACKRVAIFGSLQTADYLIQDLFLEGFEVPFIIDNFHESSIYKFDIPIIKEIELQQRLQQIDCIIVSLESSTGSEITSSLKEKFGHQVKVLWWKQLVEESIH
ncbi:glycosyltransferase family 2 protein [Paenibacillus oryzisoli]|uniref:glycosyltransferase n=1 Tax=Paenibacillus oryzisoli TaxID=1850517 RepID=UPI003D2740CB